MSSLRKVSNRSFAELLASIPEALRAEGFGILTEVDVQKTLETKIGAQVRPYRILGACNPTFAHRALEVDPEVGRFMPCNVAVYEDADGRAVVSAVDPGETMAAAGGTPALRALAADVRERLARAIAGLA